MLFYYYYLDNNWQPWLVPFGDLWFKPADEITALAFSAEDRQAIANGTKSLWVYGYFTYLNAVEDEHTHKFMARWDLVRGLVGERRPNYT